MTLHELIDNLPVTLLRGDGEMTVTDIADDSRRVRPGALFIARRRP